MRGITFESLSLVLYTHRQIAEAMSQGEQGMSIVVACPSCRASFRAAEAHLGRKARCPKCQEIIRVGGEARTAAAAAAAPAVASPAPKPQASDPLPRFQPQPVSKPRPKPAPASTPEPEAEEIYDLVAAPAAGGLARKAAAHRGTTARVDQAAPTRPTRKPTEILAAFRGEIRPVRPTATYRMWVILVAAIMIILPTLYLALIGLVGYGMTVYAVKGLALFEGVRVNKFTVVVYLTPLVCGVFVIGFMLKPLFARTNHEGETREVDPEKEPLLVAFIDGVCGSVGAPIPSRIDVDCQVNASARLATWALAPSKQLVLTIGLPLVAGLTLKQFTGVLAHEFGHFSQGAGMRLSILIRSINFWFARVVYQRDNWDESLREASTEGHYLIMLFAWVCRGAVWLTRRYLWVLMHIGHFASGFLLRQMEYDADRYEARMVGGPTFAETMNRIALLGAASNAAHHELLSCWSERRLPDDLPRLIQIEAGKMPAEIRDAVLKAASEHKTSLFDTHPAPPARIERAMCEGNEGIFNLDGPATDLFRNFDALARATTFDYYRANLGREVSRDQLFPIADAVVDQEVRRESDEAFERFFLGALSATHRLPLASEPARAPADPRAAKTKLIEARQDQTASRQAALAAVEGWNEANSRVVHAEVATAMLKVGKRFNVTEYGLDQASPRAAESALRRAEAEIERLAHKAAPFGQASADRLELALSFLELDVVVARIPGGEMHREEARALRACASALGDRIMPDLLPTARAVHGMEALIVEFQKGKEDDPAAINAMIRGGETLHSRLTELKWKIGDRIAYPFEHSRQGTTLGRFVLPSVPDAKAISDLMNVGTTARDRLYTLHQRTLGRLAAIAEDVEKAIGLARLEPPKP